MILIFRLHRPDILPLDDIALQRAFQRAYRLRRRPTPTQITRLAEPWRPWRSVACWYLWASLEEPAAKEGARDRR
jgi:DNA-3-methyladenine glycosylase II